MLQNEYFFSKIGADTGENGTTSANILMSFWRPQLVKKSLSGGAHRLPHDPHAAEQEGPRLVAWAGPALWRTDSESFQTSVSA